MGKRAIYPGSFDPVTYGHLDIICRSSKIFDDIIVGVLNNRQKNPLFSVDERVSMIEDLVKDYPNVRVDSFDGLLIDYAKEISADIIIRGLRAITDFEYEFQIDAVNRHLDPGVRTVYFMANPAHSFLSSSNVREIGEMGGSIEGLVPHCNYDYLRERLARQK